MCIEGVFIHLCLLYFTDTGMAQLKIIGNFVYKITCSGASESSSCTRWFKYDRDYLCVNKSQSVPVIFEPHTSKLLTVLLCCKWFTFKMKSNFLQITVLHLKVTGVCLYNVCTRIIDLWILHEEFSVSFSEQLLDLTVVIEGIDVSEV
jgi:hypothetical protein